MRRFSKRVPLMLAVMALIVAACGGDGGGAATTAAPDEGGSTTAPAGTEAPATTAAPSEDAVTLSFLYDDNPVTIATAEALVAAFTELHPNVTFETETRPGGGEGDNLVKTRLATGEMTDVFWYNTGSLFQALNPTETIVPITDEPFVENIVDSFLPTVTAEENVYGVPSQTAMGGGVLYNKTVYEDLGLSVPTTWEEFAANNDAILAAGITPVSDSYTDTWTSQLFVLADYYNVKKRSRIGPRSTPTIRRSMSTSRPSLGSNTCRKASRRVGIRRTSGLRPLTMVSSCWRTARSPTTRCSPSPSMPLPRTTPKPSRTLGSLASPATTLRPTGPRSGCRQASTLHPPVSNRMWRRSSSPSWHPWKGWRR